MGKELSPDQKGQASLTLGEVVVQTRNNFPDAKYRPQVYLETPYYHQYGIDPSPHKIWVTADGIGTKPELAERLAQLKTELMLSLPEQLDYRFFETLPYDAFAMVGGDVDRWGHFLLGVSNVIDTNIADPKMISALARGAKQACNEGGFAFLPGENAELGYRVSGYGSSRLNWNAVGVYLIVPEKQILGIELKPGQTVMAFQETSIRSNGLTKARSILEEVYLFGKGYPSKREYFGNNIGTLLQDLGLVGRTRGLNDISGLLSGDYAMHVLNRLMGHDFLEQMLIPWHNFNPRIVEEILKPSTLYGRIIHDAQGGVDGEKNVNIIAAAHISGGGIPEKIKRMVEPKGLGAHIKPVFPDPEAVRLLMETAEDYLPEERAAKLIDDRKACEQWNRGIGFVAVVDTQEDADGLSAIGQKHGVQIEKAGEIIAEQKIEWRGQTWNY